MVHNAKGKIMKRIVALIAVIIVVTLVGLGAWSLQNSHKTFEGAPQSITIGVPMMLDSSALNLTLPTTSTFSQTTASM